MSETRRRFFRFLGIGAAAVAVGVPNVSEQTPDILARYRALKLATGGTLWLQPNEARAAEGLNAGGFVVPPELSQAILELRDLYPPTFQRRAHS